MKKSQERRGMLQNMRVIVVFLYYQASYGTEAKCD